MFDKLALSVDILPVRGAMSQALMITPKPWLSAGKGTERASVLRKHMALDPKHKAQNGKLRTHGMDILARQQRHNSTWQVSYRIGAPYEAKCCASDECDIEQQRQNDLETFAMSTVHPEETGLPMVVFISIKNAEHGCRLKVSQIYGTKVRFAQWFSMTVEDEPRITGDTGDIKTKDIQQVKEFIRLNRHVILDFWDQTDCISPRDMVDALQHLS